MAFALCIVWKERRPQCDGLIIYARRPKGQPAIDELFTRQHRVLRGRRPKRPSRERVIRVTNVSARLTVPMLRDVATAKDAREIRPRDDVRLFRIGVNHLALSPVRKLVLILGQERVEARIVEKLLRAWNVNA